MDTESSVQLTKCGHRPLEVLVRPRGERVDVTGGASRPVELRTEPADEQVLDTMSSEALGDPLDIELRRMTAQSSVVSSEARNSSTASLESNRRPSKVRLTSSALGGGRSDRIARSSSLVSFTSSDGSLMLSTLLAHQPSGGLAGPRADP